MKKGILLLFIACLFNIHAAEAKKAKKKANRNSSTINGFSYGIVGDLGTLRRHSIYKRAYNSSTSSYDTVYQEMSKKTLPISFIYYGWNSHLILKAMGNEKSLSLNFHPSIGVSYTKGRVLSLTAPLMLCFNSGNVSTYKSKKDVGFTIGLGVEYIKAGAVDLSKILGDEEDNSPLGYSSKITNIIQPCGNFGYRFFGKTGYAQEVNLKFGMHSANPYDKFGKMPVAENTSSTYFWTRLSFNIYFGY